MTPMTPLNPSMPSPTPTSGSRRTGLLVGGVLVVLFGLVAAALLWYAAGQRHDDAIRGLARAPIGCDTTLNFAESGTYLLFVETQGTLGDIDGTCPEGGDFTTTDAPALQVSFVDDDGADLDIDLPRRSGIEYSGAGAVGESRRSVTIESPGDYTLRVQSPGDGVAIAVGRDPSDGVGLLNNLAALSAILGLIAGGILLVLGTRRREMTLAPESPQWPTATPPTSPPGMGVAVPPIAPLGQPPAGPPTTLRPPGEGPAPAPVWAAPTPAAPSSQPPQWTAPDAAADNRLTPSESDPSMWQPQTQPTPPPAAQRSPQETDVDQ